jgi:hypothetical protein
MRSHRLLAAVALAAVSALPVVAQVVPGQSELASLPATGGQHRPSISFHNGGALVTWEHDTLGVVMRRLTPAYAANGGQVVLAPNDPVPPVPYWHVTLHREKDPAVAARGDGSFVAAWVDTTWDSSADIFYPQDYLISSRVFARVFNADGTPASRAYLLSDPQSIATLPQASIGNGAWYVSWQERNGSNFAVHMASVDRRNQGADILVAHAATRPSMALAGNTLLVAYEKCCGAGGNAQIYAQPYTLAGVAAGGALRIASEGARGARAPSVAGQPTGEFFVVYQRAQPQNAGETRIYGQLIDRRGALSGGELTLSPGDGDAESAPAVVPLANGGWMAAWMTWQGAFRVAVSGAAYSRVGNMTGAPFDLNDMPIVGLELALGAGPQGRLLAAWEGFDLTGARGLRGRSAQGPTQ